MQYRFKFNGIDSDTMGVTVLARPSIKRAERRHTFENIDGRYGNPDFYDGLNTITTEMQIAVETEDETQEVRAWLYGHGIFEQNEFKDLYQEIYIVSGVTFERRVNGLYVANVQMLATDPYWYDKEDTWDSQPPSNNVVIVENKGNVESLPKIRIETLGTAFYVKLDINGVLIDLTFATKYSSITIDSKNKITYFEDNPKLRADGLFADLEFPTLQVGTNAIVSVDGGIGTEYNIFIKEESRWQ